MTETFSCIHTHLDPSIASRPSIPYSYNKSPVQGTSHLDREPGGSSLAGKVTFFKAHGRNACVFPCIETQICWGFADGCGQEGQNKGGPQLG